MAVSAGSQVKVADMSFGEYFYHLVDKRNISRPLILDTLKVSKTYLYDMFKDRVCPPTPEMQYKIASLLQATDKELSVFFDKAAKRRNELPADIMLILSDKKIAEIRRQTDFKSLLSEKIKNG
ncbi:MAG: hypothetical protein IKJ17_04195 [Clostridia bacterium]|nr:hypothetical protein [Clostridia bacterium]